MAINGDWHRAHVLGQGASMDRRVAWHLEHAAACGCRGIPQTVLDEVERRGRTAPVGPIAPPDAGGPAPQR
jgi:hypothetical protein